MDWFFGKRVKKRPLEEEQVVREAPVVDTREMGAPVVDEPVITETQVQLSLEELIQQSTTRKLTEQEASRLKSLMISNQESIGKKPELFAPVQSFKSNASSATRSFSKIRISRKPIRYGAKPVLKKEKTLDPVEISKAITNTTKRAKTLDSVETQKADIYRNIPDHIQQKAIASISRDVDSKGTKTRLDVGKPNQASPIIRKSNNTEIKPQNTLFASSSAACILEAIDSMPSSITDNFGSIQHLANPYTIPFEKNLKLVKQSPPKDLRSKLNEVKDDEMMNVDSIPKITHVNTEIEKTEEKEKRIPAVEAKTLDISKPKIQEPPTGLPNFVGSNVTKKVSIESSMPKDEQVIEPRLDKSHPLKQDIVFEWTDSFEKDELFSSTNRNQLLAEITKIPLNQLPTFDWKDEPVDENKPSNAIKANTVLGENSTKNANTTQFENDKKSFTSASMNVQKVNDTWICSICLVTNKQQSINCIACESPRTDTAKKDEPPKPTFTWTANTSTANSKANNDAENNSQSLKSSTPAFDWKSAGFEKVATAGWTCSICMVRNDTNASVCISCETPK